MVGSYPSAEKQLVYSTPSLADWARLLLGRISILVWFLFGFMVNKQTIVGYLMHNPTFTYKLNIRFVKKFAK